MRYILLMFLVLSSSPVSAFQLLNTSPSPNSVGANALTEITMVFDDVIEANSISTEHITVFGRWSGPAELDFELDGSVLTITASEGFFAGEYVMVGLNSNILSTSSEPLENGYSFGFWIEAQPGGMALTDVGHL